MGKPETRSGMSLSVPGHVNNARGGEFSRALARIEAFIRDTYPNIRVERYPIAHTEHLPEAHVTVNMWGMMHLRVDQGTPQYIGTLHVYRSTEGKQWNYTLDKFSSRWYNYVSDAARAAVEAAIGHYRSVSIDETGYAEGAL